MPLEASEVAASFLVGFLAAALYTLIELRDARRERAAAVAACKVSEREHALMATVYEEMTAQLSAAVDARTAAAAARDAAIRASEDAAGAAAALRASLNTVKAQRDDLDRQLDQLRGQLDGETERSVVLAQQVAELTAEREDIVAAHETVAAEARNMAHVISRLQAYARDASQQRSEDRGRVSVASDAASCPAASGRASSALSPSLLRPSVTWCETESDREDDRARSCSVVVREPLAASPRNVPAASKPPARAASVAAAHGMGACDAAPPSPAPFGKAVPRGDAFVRDIIDAAAVRCDVLCVATCRATPRRDRWRAREEVGDT